MFTSDCSHETMMSTGDSDYRSMSGNELASHLYADLNKLARRHLSSNRWMATLDSTALINESYLRLMSDAARHVSTQEHYLNLASRIMRQVICDFARKRMRTRSHVQPNICAEDAIEIQQQQEHEIEAKQISQLDDALNDLARVNMRHAKVVECRFFAGFSDEETASVLGISLRTVERDWASAKSWLANYMLAA